MSASDIEPDSTLRIGYLPPYQCGAMLGFLHARCIGGLEQIDPADGQTYRRSLRLGSGTWTGVGWIEVRPEPERDQLALRVSAGLRGFMPEVSRLVRSAFDLDVDPLPIDALLGADFPLGAGMRVPGTFDGFELAVRAVLGQQITVRAARTITSRLVARFGVPLDTPYAGLDRLFPSPGALADAEPDALGALGIVRQRQRAIIGLARAVEHEQLSLNPGDDPADTIARLRALPGIGDWTAQYIAMRALRWADAFPAGDVALQKALGVRAARHPARAAQAASLAWRPWRSYAVIRAWHAPAPAPA